MRFPADSERRKVMVKHGTRAVVFRVPPVVWDYRLEHGPIRIVLVIPRTRNTVSPSRVVAVFNFELFKYDKHDRNTAFKIGNAIGKISVGCR